MALTHIGQTFNADPFLKVTQYDTVAKTAALTTFDPLIVARPSVVKFTKDQEGLLVVTDRIPAGVKVIQESPATTYLRMSKNGRTVVETIGASGFNIYGLVGASYVLKGAAICAGYDFAGMTDDGTTIVFSKPGVGGSCRIYKRFGSAYILDHEFAVDTLTYAALFGERVFYATAYSSAPVRQLNIFGYADTALYGGGSYNFIPNIRAANISPSGKFVVHWIRRTSDNRPCLMILTRNAVTGDYANTAIYVEPSSTRQIHSTSLVINSTEDRVLAISYESGTPVELHQFLLGTSGTLTFHREDDISSGNVSTGITTYMMVPPNNPGNVVILRMNGVSRTLGWTGSQYSVVTGFGGFPGLYYYPLDGWVYSTGSGFAFAAKQDTNFSVPSDGDVELWNGSSTGAGTVTNTTDFPEYDEDFPVAGGSSLQWFVTNEDGSLVAYVHSGSGTSTLYGGTTETVSPLGTYVSYYERSGTSWTLAGIGEHPEGYTVKNVAFRGEDGNAVSYFLTNGPDDSVEGRYVYDGSNGSERIFELKGEVLDTALQSTFLEYGWDDYFVATYDYSDARPSTLKLYQFDDLGMTFTEKDSIEIVFGPVTLTNCWDIIVANGPLSNPFTLYKREGDEIVTQAPLAIEWFEEYGTITDMVALEDCTGFIVVTDENKVIVIEVPPVDPENPEEPRETEPKDIIELFPEPDEDLVDPAEPVEEHDQPEEPPEEIELDPETGQLVVTYPPNPNQPAPGQEGQPGQPSAPVYPPLPVNMGKPGEYPPGSVPPSPPGIPDPTQMVTNPTEGGGSIRVIARTARVSVNFAFER